MNYLCCASGHVDLFMLNNICCIDLFVLNDLRYIIDLTRGCFYFLYTEVSIFLCEDFLYVRDH